MRSIVPSVITCSAAISVREKGEQPHQALALSQERQLRGLVPCVILHSAAVVEPRTRAQRARVPAGAPGRYGPAPGAWGRRAPGSGGAGTSPALSRCFAPHITMHAPWKYNPAPNYSVGAGVTR